LIVLLFIISRKNQCMKPLGGQMFECFWHSIQFVFEWESAQAAQCCWEFQRPSLCPSKCLHFQTKAI
jgi:hypothetical protein